MLLVFVLRAVFVSSQLQGVLSQLEDSDVRLIDGGSFNQGRLEIFYEGQWGTVCGNDWSKTNAKVVCRQLGLPYIEAATINGEYFGNASGPIWLNGIRCDGSEERITGCKHNEWGHENCKFNESAGVICSGCSQSESLGVVQFGSIKNEQISASNEYFGFEAWQGRLNNDLYWYGFSTSNPWIQVDFLTAVTTSGILIQGSGSPYSNAWVSSVKFQTGDLQSTLAYVINQNKSKIFPANTNRDTTVHIKFPAPVSTRYLRIEPEVCYSLCALRFDAVGCSPVNECREEGTCDVNAVCYDFADGYKCTCKEGFIGNGFNCKVFTVSTVSSPKQISVHTGLIAGSVVGGVIFVVILVLLIMWVIIRRRNQDKHDLVGPHDRAYDDIPASHTAISPTDMAELSGGNTRINQTFDVQTNRVRIMDNIMQGNNDYAYAEFNQPSSQINDLNEATDGIRPSATSSTSLPFTNFTDNIYTYAETPGDIRQSTPPPTTSPEEGWTENIIYTSSNGNANALLQSQALDNQEEGWVDNNIYND